MKGEPRFCLWLREAPPAVLRHPLVRSKLEKVAAHRAGSPRLDVRAKAATPYLFEYDTQPSARFIAFPEVSSERRTYIPIRFLEASDIVTNKIIVVPTDSILHFGVLTSAMFMAWVRAVAGRLKSDLSPSPETVFNTFPYPDLSSSRSERISQAAAGILEARAAHPNWTLADLYDPVSMPVDLVRAHTRLDSAFGRQRQVSDASRLMVLFQRYGELVGASKPPR